MGHIPVTEPLRAASPVRRPARLATGCGGDGLGCAASPVAIERHPLGASTPSSWENLSNGTAPSPRQGAAFAYDPAGGYDLLFGGENDSQLLGDTWLFDNGSWALAPHPCPCPSPRAFAAMAFDPSLGEPVLFGGLAAEFSNLYGPVDEVTNDTWAWNTTNGAWTNLSSTISGAPTPRYAASMTWDAASDGIIVFGGNSGAGALNDTWFFRPYQWHALNLTSGPSARWGATLANSSLGYDLLFGGQTLTTALSDTWMFANGGWTQIPSCPSCGPSARSFAASAAIPANGSIMVFGGTGANPTLGDTWVFTGLASIESGPQGRWTQDTSAPSPPFVTGAAAAADFHRGVIVEFGGAGNGSHAYSNTTWGYFHLYAVLSVTPGESAQGAPVTFTASPFGGNGPYTFQYTSLPPNCASVNSSSFSCDPSHWGIYPPNVSIVDARGRVATGNTTLQVDPPGADLQLLSEYSGVFYTGFAVSDTFGVNATVWGERPLEVTALFGGAGASTSPQTSGVWNFTEEMSTASSEAPVRLVATFTNWTLRATAVGPIVVTSPSWLVSIEQAPGVRAFLSATGDGAWGRSYNLSFSEQWGLGELSLFDLPTSFLNGTFQLLPIPTVDLSLLSTGNVSLYGGLSYPPPGLSFGPFTIALNLPGAFSASLGLRGTFSATPGAGTSYVIDWTSAWLNTSIGGTFNVSYPIAGITIPDIGTIGFSLDISITPVIALSLLLGPTPSGSTGFLSGLGLAIQRLYASLTVTVTAAITVGISGVASLSGGGSLSLALLFGSLAPYFLGVWLNGSLFLSASFLCWSVTYTFLGPGTIWSWSADPAEAPHGAARPAVPTPTWTPSSRYYNVTGYDALNWTAGALDGDALPLVFPETRPALESVGGGLADLLYASDDVQQPVGSVGIEGLSLDTGLRTVTRLPVLSPPGESTFAPVVTSAPGGGAVAVFNAVPTASLESTGPAGLTGFLEQTAQLSPGATAWSPAKTLVGWGFPQSLQAGSCGGVTEVASLVSPTLLASTSGTENLVVVDAATGALLANRTVSGLTALSAFDCASGEIVAVNGSGGPELLDLATGGDQPTPAIGPAGGTLRSINFVNGTSNELLLGYSTSANRYAMLYDLADGVVVDSIVLPANASAMWAGSVRGSGVYLFVQETDRVQPFVLASNASTPLPSIPLPGLSSFQVTLANGSFVVEALGVYGTRGAPLDRLELGFVPLPSPPAAARVASPPPTLEYVAGGVLGALVAAAAVTAFLWRRERRRGPSTVALASAPREPSPSDAPAGEP